MDYEASEDITSQARAKMRAPGAIRTLGGLSKEPTDRDRTPIDQVRDEIQKEMAHLKEIAGILCERMGPLLAEVPTAATEGQVPSPSASKHGAWLSAVASEIRDVRVLLASMNERLEL